MVAKTHLKMIWFINFMATIAQLEERQIVVLNVAGSSPVGRPSFFNEELINSGGVFYRWCSLTAAGTLPLL